MLGKLIKHEFKATYKMYFLLYAGLILLSLINAIMAIFSKGNEFVGFVQEISMLVYIIMLVAGSALSLVLVIRRFYTNLFKDEGYLSHTLPVKSSSHIFAKLLVGYVWIVVTVIVALLSILILVSPHADFAKLLNNIKMIFTIVSAHGYMIRMVIGVIICFIIQLAAELIMMYAAISIGQTSLNHKALSSFVVYIVLTVIKEFVEGIMTKFIDLKNIYTFELEYAGRTALFEIPKGIDVFLCADIVIYAVFGIAFFFVSSYFIKNKLNIE